MLLDEIIKNKNNYPHVISAIEHSHKILVNNSTSLLIHCPVSNVYIAEYRGSNLISFFEFIRKYSVVRLQTTNKELHKLLVPCFANNYECVQAVYTDENSASGFLPNEQVIKLQLLKKQDLDYAAETYGLDFYIHQLYEKRRLFGYYKNNELYGYVAFHIDESIGALFVKPEHRGKGLGQKIMQAAFANYKSGIAYSQILKDNQASIKLHQKIGCAISPLPLYWVYDREFNYDE